MGGYDQFILVPPGLSRQRIQIALHAKMAIFEMAIPWSMVDGYENHLLVTPAGWALKGGDNPPMDCRRLSVPDQAGHHGVENGITSTSIHHYGW